MTNYNRSESIGLPKCDLKLFEYTFVHVLKTHLPWIYKQKLFILFPQTALHVLWRKLNFFEYLQINREDGMSIDIDILLRFMRKNFSTYPYLLSRIIRIRGYFYR